MRIRRRLTGVAAVGAAVALVLGACGSDGDGDGSPTQNRGFEDCLKNPNECNSGERADGGELTWTLDVAPDAYFPWSPEGGSVYTLQAIHGILPHFGQFQPDGTYAFNYDVLAGDPELISEEPASFSFTIKDEAVWDDGTPISADDVIITWKMSTSEGEGYCVGCRSRSSAGADDVESIVGSDDGKTVTITYKEGVAAPEWFAYGSAHNIIGGFAPAHVAGQNGWDIDNPEHLGEYFEFLNDNPPTFSGGPYLIDEFDIDNHVIKVPNPNWYGEHKATLDRLVLRFLTEADTWIPALQNGELHGASPAGYAEDVIEQLQSLDGVRVHIGAGPSWEHVDLNMDNEWLGEHKALRQAIFTAIDRDDIAERNFGRLYPDYQVRTNHVHSASSEFHKDHVAASGQGSGDLTQAQQILADAGFEGYEDGAGALTYEGETVPAFRLRATNAPARVIATQLIQEHLAGIGVEAILEPTDDLGGTLVAQDYDLMLFGWSGSPLFTGAGGQYWKCDSGSNFGKYCNEEVDALIEQESQATTLEESAALHDQMMELVVDDAYVLPLYDSPVYVFVAEQYVNVRDNANTSLRALYEHHMWGVAVQ